MRNAVLPPVSAQFYHSGNSETQIPNMDVSMAVDHNVSGTSNLQRSSIYWEPRFFCDWNQQRSSGFAVPYQSIINFLPGSVNPRDMICGNMGYQSTSSDLKNISYQSMLLSKKFSVPDVEMDAGTIKLGKHPYEIASLLPQTAKNDVVERKKARFSSEWKEKKSTKAKFTEEKLHNLITGSTNIQDFYKVPVKRSQKLSDKITALQKLVSPYGKTDTASVLQEARLYIKLLHEQIQNLFDMLCSSYHTDIGGEFRDLKRRGFCLVPASLIQNLTQEECLHPHEYSRKSFMA